MLTQLIILMISILINGAPEGFEPQPSDPKSDALSS